VTIKSEHQEALAPRWARNAALARYLNVSAMCIWRWQRDPKLGFPQPTRINGISYTDREAVDAWMRSRIGKRENVA
jgi:predicted DNA-binding transcriptional regulator AlpA